MRTLSFKSCLLRNDINCLLLQVIPCGRALVLVVVWIILLLLVVIIVILIVLKIENTSKYSIVHNSYLYRNYLHVHKSDLVIFCING